MNDGLVLGVKRMIVDFGADIVVPRSPAHLYILDTWTVRATAIIRTIGFE